MDTERNYSRLASDCLKMAEKTRDPATRADMTRLARLWARLAQQQVKNRTSTKIDHGRAA
jgi:hypothetical protein